LLPGQQLIDRAALERAVQLSPALKLSVASSTPWPWRVRTQPFSEMITVTGSSTTLTSATTFFLLDQGAAGIAKGLGIGLDFLADQAAHGRSAAQDVLELALLAAQLGQLLLDLDGFQARQLAQTDFKNVLGLTLGD
jgi:hypothetical protein